MIGSVRWAAKKSGAFLGVMYAYMTEYRAELILWALANSLPFILMGVWMKAGTSGAFELGPDEFARYFLCVFIVRQLTVVWVIWEFEYELLHGNLSPRLLLPIDPVWRYVASHLSERLARMPFAAGLVVLLFALYEEARFVPSLGSTALAIAFILLAFLLRFVVQYTFAMLAFWTERAASVESLWNLLFLFLSGYIAPLTLFPDAVRDFTLLTPFPYLIYVPVAILLDLEVDLAMASAVMVGWIAVFFVANRVLWRLGLRRYSAMGA